MFRLNPLYALVCFFALSFTGRATAQILYVDADATDTPHNGSSWCNAFLNVQDALAAAQAGDTIRVAEGVYKPDEGGGQTPGNRSATFQLINDVTLEGGYAGCGAPDPDARDVGLYKTILSGDIGVAGNSSDNSYHVVTGSGTDATAVLDGFTIQDGNASGAWQNDQDVGGGLYIDAGSATVLDCTFDDNAAVQGGGVYAFGGGSTLTLCDFTENTAGDAGAGVFITGGCSATLNGCTFTSNVSSGDGGGMASMFSDPDLVACIFSVNTASGAGGGMYNYNSSPMVTDSMFDRNSASGAGGGVYNGEESSPTLRNCAFTGNASSTYGGGMSNLFGGGCPVLINCYFSHNTAGESGAAMRNYDADPTLTNCTFWYNDAGVGGGGLSNANSIPVITNCIFWENEDAGGRDESAQIEGGTPVVTHSCIDECAAFCADLDDHNIRDDPRFVDADGADNQVGTPDDNLRISQLAPCIDAGDNGADTAQCTPGTQVLPPEDFDGNVRKRNDLGYPWVDPPAEPPDHTPIVDMGAFEFAGTSVTPRLYVDADATGDDTGTSWSDAFVDLQSSLAIARTWPDLVDEIWVAAGTYMPDGGRVTSSKEYYAGTKDPAAYFQFASDVAVYGGFAGSEPARAYCSLTTGQSCLSDSGCPSGETCQDARDFAYCFGGTNAGEPCGLDANCDSDTCQNVTVLSGDLNYDDGPLFVQDFAACFSGNTIPLQGACQPYDLNHDNDVDASDLSAFLAANNRGDNSFRISVAGHSTSRTLTIDGLTITAGITGGGYDQGPGMWITTDPTIRNCTFVGNSAGLGAIFSYGANPVISNCRFIGNVATWAGGAILHGGTGTKLTIADCTFHNNAAGNTGGAVYLESGSLTLTGSIFEKNTASSGGALSSRYGGQMSVFSIAHCQFLENRFSSQNRGGLARR